ncbi:MAG: glycoside hydrolase family 2 TIM barrel-domain containing protein [Elusimicrobiota bacterium]|jgi:beta-glucuronidase
MRYPIFATLTLVVVPAWLWAGDIQRPLTRADAAPSQDSLTLAFPGVKGPVPYLKFGKFENLGTPRYRYLITDFKKLASVVGEGIYPNTSALQDPRYKTLLQEGRLKGNHWNFVDTPNAALNFYKWVSTAEDPGVKQFYTSIMLERLGLTEEAIKGYYAVAVHFPKTISYTYFNTPWYVGCASLDRLEQLLRRHPQFDMRWTGGGVTVQNKFDTLTSNDKFSADPGQLVPVRKWKDPSVKNISKLAVIKTVGGPRTQLRQYANHHWQFFVDGKPFVIRGITYSLTPVGLSPDFGTWDVSKDWQLIDTNHNGLNDGFFESYIDKNGNGQQDLDEPAIGDAQLLKDMGVNTLRIYHHIYDKELFRRLHREYGFYFLCGDLLGGYSVGSGASWKEGTDYRNPTQQQTMLNGVRQMVEEYKDEPYILMWVIGNENVYGVANNAKKDPEAFFELVDRAAELIHQLDPTRPVAVANGDILFMDIMRAKCPHVDVIGANVYRGEQGFGRNLFRDIQNLFDRPALVTEYGAPAYGGGFSQAEAEAYQAMYLGNSWEDLEAHMAGYGVGNALGGVLFEFVDEWWKAWGDLPLRVKKEKAAWYDSRAAGYKDLRPENHDPLPQFGGPFLDGWSYEEWFGIVSLGNGQGSPFARTLRPAYFTLKEMWNPSSK